MKAVVVGGSAQSTPALWSHVNSQAEDLHMVLMGRDPVRLQAICRACRLLSETTANTLEYRTLDDEGAWKGLEDASVFIIQIRNGGYAGRAMDETLPLHYAVCGDEGLGPGGLAAGIRNWRSIQPLLKQIARTAPGAQVLLVSSPVSLLVRAATRVFPRLRIAGICELPWTTLLEIGAAVGVPANSLQFDYLGVNHLGWFYRLEVDGQDVIQRYKTLRTPGNGFPSAALIEACGGVPLSYLKLHYERPASIDAQRQSARSRGEVLGELSKQAFEIYATGTRDDIEQALRRRPCPWYSHAIAPFIAFMAGRLPRLPFFLSVPNCGLDSQFEPDDIVECAHAAEAGGLRRLPLRTPVPFQIRTLLTEFVRYERVAADALLMPEQGNIEKALEAHPWTRHVPDMTDLAHDVAHASGMRSYRFVSR
jgi:6-phospho-beta-glucosidase